MQVPGTGSMLTVHLTINLLAEGATGGAGPTAPWRRPWHGGAIERNRVMSDLRRQRFGVLATSLVLSIALAIIALPLISSQALSETRKSVSLQSSDPTPTPFSFAAGGD